MNVRRRSFIGSAGAFACLAPTCLGATEARTWEGWKPGHFQIHSIYTGAGESLFLVYPDGTSLLIDCGDYTRDVNGPRGLPQLPSAGQRAGERVARYVRRVNPRGTAVDYFLLTHYHSDHAGCGAYHAGRAPNGQYALAGIGQAMEYLSFSRAIDRAWPTFDDPRPMSDDFDEGTVRQMRAVYAELQRRGTVVERFRLEAKSPQLGPLHGTVPDFALTPLCANGRVLQPDGTVRDLYATDPVLKAKGPVNENAMSVGLRFDYGPFRFFTAGDFSDGPQYQCEKALAKVCGRADVAKANHHAHWSMPPALVAALRSRIWLVNVWESAHLVSDTLGTLVDRRVYAGPRTIYPGIFPPSRRTDAVGRRALPDIDPGALNGAHVVIDVEPGGLRYSVVTLDAHDEALSVLTRRTCMSGENAP